MAPPPVKKTVTAQAQPVQLAPEEPTPSALPAAVLESPVASPQVEATAPSVQEEMENFLNEGTIDEIADDPDFPDEEPEDPPVAVAETATKPAQVTATAASEPATDAPKVANFKEFGNGAGATLFDDAAIAAAAALNIPTETATNDSPFVKLDKAQIAAVVPVLQEQGWEVNQKNAQITLHGGSASVRGEAATAIAGEFGFELGATQKGVPKVKFDQGKLEDVIGFLKDQQFVVGTQEAEPSDRHKKPVVVFRESLTSDDYKVFDTSAKNLAQAMGRELDQTPGGRPLLEVTSQERKQLMREQGDTLDMSVKPLPEAKMSLYASGGGNVIGDPAVEVAAALGLETETVTRRSDGATFPRVSLTAEQIEPAKAALEGMFSVREHQLSPIEKAALIKLDKAKDEIVIVGDAAPVLAEAKGIEPKISQKGSPFLRLRTSELEDTKATLREAGFEKFDIQETKPLQQRSTEPRSQENSSPKPRLKQKAAAGMEL